jgi:hypothetical protein
MKPQSLPHMVVVYLGEFGTWMPNNQFNFWFLGLTLEFLILKILTN